MLVIDGIFRFKDQVMRGSRNRTKEIAIERVNAIRRGHNFDADVVKQLRKAERGMAGVTCDVVANAVEWAKKRPGRTCVFGSPFEADAQVSHLVRIGLADVGATTDSDVLTFCCPLILYDHFKLSSKDGAMVQWGNTCSPEINKLCPAELVTVSCLTGCDYINRLTRMSLSKAGHIHNFVV